MHEELRDVTTPDGTMDTFLVHPHEGPAPAVILFMDIWGLREELFDIARRIATVGYTCLVPNLYYREGRVRQAIHGPDGKMVSFDRLDAAEQQRVLGPLSRLTNAMVIQDALRLRDMVREAGLARGPMGTIGYCMGGRFVLALAGRDPKTFRAGASLHGTSLVSEAPDSPHRLIGAMRGEFYCGFGEKDPFARPEVVAALKDAFAANPAVRYHFTVHPGAAHGYALPDRDIHDARATEDDFAHIFAMFRRQLQTG